MLKTLRKLAVALLLVCLLAGSAVGLLASFYSPAAAESDSPAVLTGPGWPVPLPPGDGDSNSVPNPTG
jgi:hypothetical protein